MRKHSEFFGLILIAATFSLAHIGQSIYEDAAKAWVVAKLTQVGFGAEATAVLSGLAQVAPAFGAAAIIVWALYWYIRREFEKTSLLFERKLNIPAGELGYYTAYLVVQNTSPTEKLSNCRCEMIELRAEDGSLLVSNIGLRTKGQENKEIQGRFNLDQASQKEIPIFQIDQSRDDDNALKVINANMWDLNFEHGIYFAKIRGYGDSGKPDEIMVRLNTQNCNFAVVGQMPRETEAPR